MLISDLDAYRDIDAPWCPEMVALPVGEFLMGSPEDEKERYSGEGPQHRVMIGYRFGLGHYPVTVVEYRKFVEVSGHRHEGGMYIRTGSDYESQELARSGNRADGSSSCGRRQLAGCRSVC